MTPTGSFLSWIFPGKPWRKELRNRLFKSKDRRKSLIGYGCKLEGDTAITAAGIRFDISDHAKIAAHIGEILIDEVYNFACKDAAVVIDIGMNRGLASLYFASQQNVKKVYAFEPFGPTLALAQRNLELNPHLKDKIEACGFGLGKENTTLQIPYAENVSDLMSTTHQPPAKQNLRNETVLVKDAAEILGPILERHQDTRVIIKCDCEGAEFEIMERLGEANLLEKIDGLLMEYHFEEPDRLVNILSAAGFAVHYRGDKSKKSIVGLLYAINMHGQNTAIATPAE